MIDTPEQLAEKIHQKNETCETCGFHCSDRRRNSATKLLTEWQSAIYAETLTQAIRALETMIHQEKVRVSGKYTEKFAAQDVSKEEVAHCHSPASIAWQNAIEVIKLDSPDPHYGERIKLKERINASENIQLNVGMLLAIYPAARQETIKEIGLYIERTKSQLAALDAPKGEGR